MAQKQLTHIQLIIGNEAKLFFGKYRQVTAQLKNKDYVSVFSLLLKRLGTILIVINSNDKVDD